MHIGRQLSLLLMAALCGFGCGKSNNSPPVPDASSAADGQPQVKLRTIKIWLGTQEMVAEAAQTPSQVQKGMMFRKTMAENEGMLFVFSQPHRAAFWMKNTLLPLSCAYLDSEGNILEIHDMKPLDETPIQAASEQIRYVLETKQGWFERNHVGAGALVRTEFGSLEQTFFGGRGAP